MTGFELRISGDGSNRSYNYATTTAIISDGPPSFWPNGLAPSLTNRYYVKTFLGSNERNVFC